MIHALGLVGQEWTNLDHYRVPGMSWRFLNLLAKRQRHHTFITKPRQQLFCMPLTRHETFKNTCQFHRSTRETVTKSFAWNMYWLVVWTPLKHMKVNWDDYSQYVGKSNWCSKPPTSANLCDMFLLADLASRRPRTKHLSINLEHPPYLLCPFFLIWKHMNLNKLG